MDDIPVLGEKYNNTFAQTVLCYAGRISTTNGLWQGDNPLAPVLPIFPQQMVWIIALTRVIAFLLKPFKMPRFTAEILGGLLLSPQLLGSLNFFKVTIFPYGSLMVLETVANLGILYFSFLLGLEIDMKTIIHSRIGVLHIAIVGVLAPFFAGVCIYFILGYQVKRHVSGPILCGTALTVTSFTVMTQVLADLKLLHGDMGRTAISASIVSDVFSWGLFAMGMMLSYAFPKSFWVFASTLLFLLVCNVVIGPAIGWLLSETDKTQSLSKFQICLVLTGVSLVAFMAEMCGMHSVIGAFVFGLCIPNGLLRSVLIEKLEDVVSGLLLPLFYGVSGLKTSCRNINLDGIAVVKMVFCIVLACAAKVVGTVFVASFHKVPLLDSMALGLLMNIKGLMAVVILNIARDKAVIDELVFLSLLIAIVLMTSIVPPILDVAYKPARKTSRYTQRTLESLPQEAVLKILACINSSQNIPGITGLLRISNATTRSPICVFSLHLVELIGRASSMLVVHSARRSNGQGYSRIVAESEQIADSFEKFEQETTSISVQSLTAMSSYTTMHEDICSYAEDKHVNFLLIPFHQQQKLDGTVQEENPCVRGVNRSVLDCAPCSVGIFLDRGLGGQSRDTTHVCVLFFGGPDDRESLVYARRMISGNPSVSLTIIRFLLGDNASSSEVTEIPEKTDGVLTVFTYEFQKPMDDQFLNRFRMETKTDERVTYVEMMSNNGEETISLIKGMDHHYDLYIVGKGDRVISPLTAGLNDWSECPELGAIGDLLVSTDCAQAVSVLVVQQYVGTEQVSLGFDVPDGAVGDRAKNTRTNRSGQHKEQSFYSY